MKSKNKIVKVILNVFMLYLEEHFYSFSTNLSSAKFQNSSLYHPFVFALVEFQYFDTLKLGNEKTCVGPKCCLNTVVLA